MNESGPPGREPIRQGRQQPAGRARASRRLLGLAGLALAATIGGWGLQTWRLRAIYEAEAATFADLESKARLAYGSRDVASAGMALEAQVAAIDAEAGGSATIAWLGQMRRRYAYAASHPWETLPPAPAIRESQAVK